MRRVVVGNRDGSYGLWISKPGRDAYSTSDDDFMVTPSFVLSQPWMQGTITQAQHVTTTAANGAYTYYYSQGVIAHGLGYPPIALAFGLDYYNKGVITCVDNQNVYVCGGEQYYLNAPPASVNWTYVILKNRLY